MDPKLYKFLELVFIAGLLVVVLYLGGLFDAQPLKSTISAPVNLTVIATQVTGQAEFEATRIHLTLTARATPPAGSTPRVSSTQTPAFAPITNPSVYLIAPGDTCIAIAARFDVSLQSLIELNDLDGECLIFAGEALRIPQPTPTIAP